MTRYTTILFFLLLSAGCRTLPSEEASTGVMSSILQQIIQKDFFSARDALRQNKEELHSHHRKVIEALLYNAFNQTQQSTTLIDELLADASFTLVDSLERTLLEIKQDNAVKQYQYNTAREAVAQLIERHTDSLTPDELKDYQNSLKLWTILQDQPPQSVTIPETTVITMTKDIAGLSNLAITTPDDTVDFIFDTGANISTVSMSTAEKLGMHLLPDSILVGTITGNQVYAQLALSETLHLDAIEIQNAVFLVFDDAHLAFPQINYQINGIIGFPVIEALGKIQLTRDGQFIVSKEVDTTPYDQNMALDHLSPVIQLDGRHYNFDTGADQTMLFKRYFDDHQAEIEASHEETEIQFGGAGGTKTYRGYHIPFSCSLNGREIKLNQIPVLKEELTDRWRHIYGNIGQDLIQQFETMTLNFREMYIAFE